MFIGILLFLCGDLCLQTFAHLPNASIIVATLIITLLLCLIFYKYQRYHFLAVAFVLGFCWSAWHAHEFIAKALPHRYEGHPLLVTGRIASLPVTSPTGTHFIFVISKLKLAQSQSEFNNTDLTAKIMWRTPDANLRPGDQRQLMLNLKRIHGSQSPGAFDFEAWSVQNGLNATGYVLNGSQNKLLTHDWYSYPLTQLRLALLLRIQPHLPVSNTSIWLLALMLGERNGIAQQDWQVLRNTGTNHLMAIAGLHIGMMAGLMHVLVSWCWRRLPSLTLHVPAHLAGSYAALMVAIIYAMCAGFSLPAQRATIMLGVFSITQFTRRKINPWSSWATALLIVLLLNDASVLTESFWLSFGTIALIIYGMRARLAPVGWWWKWGRVQWIIGIGLTPLSLAFFQQSSFISFIANSIAIPWLGLLILPWCLLGGLFVLIAPGIGDLLLQIADKSLMLLWHILSWLAALDLSSWHHAIASPLVLCVTVFGFILLLLPTGFPGKWLGVIWIAPLMLIHPTKPQVGNFFLTVLDVGQGLSVVVQTRNHILVYDAGPKFADNLDMGESVVLPYLRTIDAKQIDMLMISHGDNDHIGGANAIINNLSVLSVLTSVPEKLASSVTQYCFAGAEWNWDGVHFSILYPTRDNLHLSNDSSCVLRIDNGSQSVLLTGDIEKYAERDLLTRIPAQLSTQVLVAPHHGSKTSGITAFVNSTHPQFVLYATGCRNRYRFPHHAVVNAYASIGAEQLNTAQTGTISFELNHDKLLQSPKLYREWHKRYWMDE